MYLLRYIKDGKIKARKIQNKVIVTERILVATKRGGSDFTLWKQIATPKIKKAKKVKNERTAAEATTV
jgi:hypothetical protein